MQMKFVNILYLCKILIVVLLFLNRFRKEERMLILIIIIRRIFTMKYGFFDDASMEYVIERPDTPLE